MKHELMPGVPEEQFDREMRSLVALADKLLAGFRIIRNRTRGEVLIAAIIACGLEGGHEGEVDEDRFVEFTAHVLRWAYREGRHIDRMVEAMKKGGRS